MNITDLAETGMLPDALIRVGIRHLLARRQRSIPSTPEERAAETSSFVTKLRSSPLAVATDTANRQHYEVPTEFFQLVLGPRLKYSCSHFSTADTSLRDAEEQMLEHTCNRAGIEDGQRILELGCGWGSLTLWMAQHFRHSQITAVSNSRTQREFIEKRAQAQGLENISVMTADMTDFECQQTFDRVVSVEMFEHMRNYELLLHRVSRWLTPNGRAFVHVFCHRETPYLFETEGSSNWMGRHFFTGGMMPSANLFSHFDRDLRIEQQWRVDGTHYWRTCEAWLKNCDQNRDAILNRFAIDLPAREAKRNLQRWRIFFMACAELFRYSHGQEWFVTHYRFSKNGVKRRRIRSPNGSNNQLDASSTFSS